MHTFVYVSSRQGRGAPGILEAKMQSNPECDCGKLDLGEQPKSETGGRQHAMGRSRCGNSATV